MTRWIYKGIYLIKMVKNVARLQAVHEESRAWKSRERTLCTQALRTRTIRGESREKDQFNRGSQDVSESIFVGKYPGEAVPTKGSASSYGTVTYRTAKSQGVNKCS